ncbi:CaiB/BaiF CoA transferase family protein [Ottowia thiooxydans]|uniref:CaiB/BaiF CoA transferase family protein n=1 Tax=Ottowia thiooxydans TaxID=219182 RepID=UPI000491D862|nr:CoA transferase [Ottowia thiooxydans]
MTGPLSGVRVLDLTHILAGPFGTMFLAHMGAEVIKIEYGDGDRFRRSWMPPGSTEDGYEFLAVNANKKHITLNLKNEEGRQIFKEMVAKSDVIVENFSLGVMERMGFSYEELKEINPRIIYASSRGFGDSGPYAEARAYAYTIMAISGWINKSWEYSGAYGTKTLGIGDEASGVSMAMGICAALYSRSVTGKGQKIEVSMQEALLGFMVSTLHSHFENMTTGAKPQPCKDGYMAFHFGGTTDAIWRRFAAAMGHPDMGSDPRFATENDRRDNLAELQEMVSMWLMEKPKDELWKKFRELGIASAPVLAIGEVIEDEHIKARGAFTEVEHPERGKMKLLSPWIRFSDTPAKITHAGGAVGQHNAEVYGDLLGYSSDDVARLTKEGVF